MLHVDRLTINYFDFFPPFTEQLIWLLFYGKATQYLHVLVLNNWKRSIVEDGSLHQLSRVSLRRGVIVRYTATRPTPARPAFNWQLTVPPSQLYPTADKNDEDARILPTTRRFPLCFGCSQLQRQAWPRAFTGVKSTRECSGSVYIAVGTFCTILWTKLTMREDQN